MAWSPRKLLQHEESGVERKPNLLKSLLKSINRDIGISYQIIEGLRLEHK